MSIFPKLVIALLFVFAMTSCAGQFMLNQYRNDIRKQCEADAELLEMSVEECFAALNIRDIN